MSWFMKNIRLVAEHSRRVDPGMSIIMAMSLMRQLEFMARRLSLVLRISVGIPCGSS